MQKREFDRSVSISAHVAHTTTMDGKTVLSRVPSKWNGLANIIGGAAVGVVWVLLMVYVG